MTEVMKVTEMRYGFTTGSCAAAAAKAAAYMLLFGTEKNTVEIKTPGGKVFKAEILNITRGEGFVSCAVEKDGGDDPDVTSGLLVFARVSFAENTPRWEPSAHKDEVVTSDHEERDITIDGGEGVGRVTRAGLDQPVGAAAINRVPRMMIKNEVEAVCRLADFCGALSVTISVPRGEEIAKKTFNPRLGIEGGISIIGTSGIVEPMSSKALIDTIRLELNVRRSAGADTAFITPGNYGLEHMKSTYGYDLENSVKCSNFIGDTIDILVELGFKNVLLTGHIGKLIKVSGGIMNTHSRESDARMELLAAFAGRYGIGEAGIRDILECVNTDEALRIIRDAGVLSDVMEYALLRILFHLERRAGGRLNIQCIIYSNELGELAKSAGADELMDIRRARLSSES